MKKRIIFLLSLLFCSVLAMTQVTIIVDKLPDNTPANAQVYIAGSFNNWTPNATPLAKTADGRFRITLPSFDKPIEFKFTRGSWKTGECSSDGGFLANRTASETVNDEQHYHIAAWDDLVQKTTSNTANEQVSVMTDSFYIPQLDRYRRVWLYLPKDYATSKERYSVLYMHDGQNIFDAATSYSGEWGVDETLARLEVEKGLKLIVVGIDNAGDKRLDEYTPWENAKFGGGEGGQYVDFLVKTLKPYIDKTYRTKPERQHTALMGSSLGGLISMYGIMEYPDVFGKAGVFSPSFWFSKSAFNQVKTVGKQHEDTKIFMLMGQKEGKEMVKGINKMNKILSRQHFSTANLYSITKADGEHKEWFWQREFEQAILWLFTKN